MRIFLCLLCCSLAYGCIDFGFEAEDGTWIIGRSLEFAEFFDTKLRVFPRNQRMVSKTPDQKRGVQWVSKYGYVGATAFGQNFSFDGLNEMGLSFGYLWLPGVTDYPNVAPEEMKMALDFVDFGAWVLGNFSSVDEVKAGLKNVRIWGHPVPPLPGIPPVHIALHDAEGNHLVIEFVGGSMQVYDNLIGVLTNSPPFDWQMINLQNFTHLNAENADPYTFRGMTISQPGQGSGLLGIPGDWSPPSRFVRMATYLRFAKPAANAKEGVNMVEHLLNTVDIPHGEIREKGKDTGDYTQWIVIKDLKQKVFYFRSYNDLSIKMIDLKRLNFDTGSSKTLPFEVSKGYIDMTNTFNTKDSTTAQSH